MCNICQNKQASLGQRFFAWTTSKSDATQHKIYGSRKEKLFKKLSGTILEIGPGTGINFDYYPQDIEWIGLEPNAAMQRYLLEKAEEKGFPASILSNGVEHIPMPDSSIDYVVCTLVLCSVNSQDAALEEIKRVLKPEGKFVFIEHVGAQKGSRTRKLQEFLRPAWKFLADGCDPARDTAEVLEKAGFSFLKHQSFTTNAPFGYRVPHIAGEAVK